MQEITAICRVFLWTGKELRSKKALVAWERVCASKSSGGWNLTQLDLWNKAAVMKLLWHIANKKDKLWVRWVHIFYIKNKDLWQMNIPNKCSWNLKKILRLRADVNAAGGWGRMVHRGGFSTKMAYGMLRGDNQKVRWYRVIHCNPASPRSRFIAWLVVLDRLYTRSRLL